MKTSPTHTRWLIVTLIFCIGVLMFIDRVNIAIAAKYIMPEYGLSDVQMGWIFSAFVFGYAVLQIPGGTLGDRFGPRRVLAGAIFWWSAFTAVTAVAGDWLLTSLTGVLGSFIVVRALKRSSLACPQYHPHHRDQAHSRLTSAITAPQTPRWRPPAPGDYASQPLTGTRRAALLGTCARARAPRRHAPSAENASDAAPSPSPRTSSRLAGRSLNRRQGLPHRQAP